jgi:glycosyl transferase, family 25
MPDPQRPAVFVLTFPDAGAERQVSPQTQFERLPTPLDWSLVMGFGPQAEVVDELYDPLLNSRWMKRPLAAAEVAVYAGHRKMYAEFLSGKAEFGLFLEDDFEIKRPADFQFLIDHIELAMADADMLKLFNFGEKPGRVLKRRICGPIEIAKHHRNSAGAVGYVLSRRSAVKLLAKSKLFRQIDEDFKHPWEFGLNVWSVTPNLVSDNSRGLGGSLLEADRLAIKRSHCGVATSMKGNYLTIRRKLLGLFHSLSDVRN